jgi:DASH complex subunit DAM1
MENVIEGLMNAPNRTVKRMSLSLVLRDPSHGKHPLGAVTDLIKPPDLIQARVNKCLIALVNRKAVRKDNSSVRSRWNPLRS